MRTIKPSKSGSSLPRIVVLTAREYSKDQSKRFLKGNQQKRLEPPDNSQTEYQPAINKKKKAL